MSGLQRGDRLISVRGLVLRLVSSLCVLAGGLLFASAPVLAAGTGEEGCPNEALRQGPSSSLGECRAYEMVSPVYKGGFGASLIEAVSPDGNTAAYFSPGQFAGAPAGFSGNANGLDYVARRGTSGWATVPVMPPASLAPYSNYHDISPTLSSVLTLARPGATNEGAALTGTEDEFLLHDSATADVSENWEHAGPVLKTLTGGFLNALNYEDASEDFCHLLLQDPTGLNTGEENQLLRQAVGAINPLYEVNRGCHGENAEVKLVAVNSAGKPISTACAGELGIYAYNGLVANLSNAISSDGSEIFFTSCVKNILTDYQVFLRLAGARTIEISRPIDTALEHCEPTQIPCPGAQNRPSANFAGASEDGSKVYFTTSAPLVKADTDDESDLYVATIGCPAGEAECAPVARGVIGLTQASRSQTGEAAGVQGVLKVSPDGSRAYFVATGDLLSSASQAALGAEGRPVPHAGAANLYVYDDQTKQVSFIGDLCTGFERSNTAEDTRCPGAGSDLALWHLGSEHEDQTAGADGRFLVFASYAQLTADDTDAAKDIYRYDAVTGSLQRVSLGQDGASTNGNGPTDARIAENHLIGEVKFQHELGDRAVSEDGSRVVFTSSEPLAVGAEPGQSNVYIWQSSSAGGNVSPISRGGGTDPVISPAGNDVFFATTQGLVPQDTDGESDIYDARVDGGFAPELASREHCSSDACQGPLSALAPLLVPGSVSQAPEENLPASVPAPVPAPKSKPSVHPCPKHRVRRHGKCVKTPRKTRSKAKKAGSPRHGR
jgi:hypothetical protein